jgi:hypothetical protein
MRRTLVVLAVLVALGAGCAARRALVQPSEHLGITRVVLFQNGLGYVQREGATDSRFIELVTRREQVDDVLKSLTVVDRRGDQVASVRVLPSAEGDETVRLQVGLAKAARHDLAISYVAELSGWRPTYRVVDEGHGKVRLQGMAVVDNLTGEPWRDVTLALSTDLPLSFRYALSEPRRAERPELTNTGRLVRKAAPMLAVADAMPHSEIQAAYAQHNAYASPEISNRAGFKVLGNEANGEPGANDGTEDVDPLRALDESGGVGSMLIGSPSGFSLDDGESGLVPFVDRQTQGELVLLYKPATTGGPSQSRPYHAVLFRNPLAASLLTGPVAVYSGDRFLGDGVTGTIPAGSDAFVAFATAPSVLVQHSVARGEDDVRALSITGGTLRVMLQATVRHTFHLSSSRAWDQRVFLFVEALDGYEPRELPAGTIVTETGFFVPTPPGQREAQVTFELVREQSQDVVISAEPTHAWVPALLDLLASSGDSDVDRLRRIADRLEELSQNEDRWREDLEVRRETLEEQREALRALREVPANADLRRRLGTSVAQGVAQVDELTRHIVEGNAESVSLRQEWYDRLRSIEVGGR